MIYVYGALGLVLALILVVQGGGMMLPVGHVARVERLLPATPERVWNALTDVERYPSWRAELRGVKRTSEDPPTWTETSKFGEMPLKVEASESPKRLVVRIDGQELPFGGTWTYELTPEGAGTRLAITENGEVYPPAFRFLSKFVFGHAKTIEGFLSQLEAHLKKEANRDG